MPYRARSERYAVLNCIGPTSWVPFVLRTHWPGLPPSFSATAKTMLAGTSYFTAAEIEQTTRSCSSGGRSAMKGSIPYPPPSAIQPGMPAALFILAPDAFLVFGQGAVIVPRLDPIPTPFWRPDIARQRAAEVGVGVPGVSRAVVRHAVADVHVAVIPIRPGAQRRIERVGIAAAGTPRDRGHQRLHFRRLARNGAQVQEVEPGLDRVRELALGDPEIPRQRGAALARPRSGGEAQNRLAGQARIAGKNVLGAGLAGCAERHHQGGKGKQFLLHG